MMDGCGTTAAAPGVLRDAPAAVVAPFVDKTYRMVDDPSTDAVIAWGRDNNSLVVADHFALAQTLLPVYFRHGNFSSFVRQLNTYGFRKVHPDRWEFAHASFLRGQTHLLHRVVRRRSAGGSRRKDDGSVSGSGSGNADDEDTAARVAMEVDRLRREQKADKERVAAIRRRVQEAERRPRQMLASFLVKAAGDPQVVRRLLQGGGGHGGRLGAETEDREAAKRARMLPADSARGQLGAGGSNAHEAAGSQAESFDGGGGCGEDEFDFTGFLTGDDDAQVDAMAGGGEGGYPMHPF